MGCYITNIMDTRVHLNILFEIFQMAQMIIINIFAPLLLLKLANVILLSIKIKFNFSSLWKFFCGRFFAQELNRLAKSTVDNINICVKNVDLNTFWSTPY